VRRGTFILTWLSKKPIEVLLPKSKSELHQMAAAKPKLKNTKPKKGQKWVVLSYGFPKEKKGDIHGIVKVFGTEVNEEKARALAHQVSETEPLRILIRRTGYNIALLGDDVDYAGKREIVRKDTEDVVNSFRSDREGDQLKFAKEHKAREAQIENQEAKAADKGTLDHFGRIMSRKRTVEDHILHLLRQAGHYSKKLEQLNGMVSESLSTHPEYKDEWIPHVKKEMNIKTQDHPLFRPSPEIPPIPIVPEEEKKDGINIVPLVGPSGPSDRGSQGPEGPRGATGTQEPEAPEGPKGPRSGGPEGPKRADPDDLLRTISNIELGTAGKGV